MDAASARAKELFDSGWLPVAPTISKRARALARAAGIKALEERTKKMKKGTSRWVSDEWWLPDWVIYEAIRLKDASAEVVKTHVDALKAMAGDTRELERHAMLVRLQYKEREDERVET